MSNIHNISIEQCVLAALMTVQNSYETVMGDLTTDCFYANKHQDIYKAIVSLADKNKLYDVLMVEQQLNQENTLFDATEYLKQLMAEAASSFYNLESYVAELVKFKNHREVEVMGRSIQEVAKDLSVTDIHNAAENILSQGSTSDKAEKTSFTFEEAVKRSGEQLIQKAQAKATKQFVGVKFNLPHLDNLVGTIQKGHFCVIGGRPGSGKSTLAQMVAIQTAMQFQEAVLVVSAEMDVETFTNRCISAVSQIPFSHIHNAELENETHLFVDAQERLGKLKIHVEDKQKPTISEIHSYARKAKRNYKKLGCIIVDYLQLVRDPSKKDRYQEVSSISRDLKAMAKEFDCPVIALAQLNRESEKGKRPKPSDLKESGQIEQDADQILLVHPVVNPNDDEPTGITEIIVGKNRHGKKGIARVADRLDICRFVGIQEDSRVGGAA